MVLFRGDIKCKSLQRRTSISVILPADNIHFLQDTEEIVPQPYRTLYLLHGLYGSDDIFLAVAFLEVGKQGGGIGQTRFGGVGGLVTQLELHIIAFAGRHVGVVDGLG